MSTLIQMKYSEKTGGFTASSHVDRLMFRRSPLCQPMIASLRLHRNPQRKRSGDFAEDCFRFIRKFKQSSATRAAKHMQPLFVPHRGKRGSGGKALAFALTFPCHYCLRQTPPWGDVARECPGGFAPLSTRESGYQETQSNLQGSLKLLFTSSSSPSPSAPCRP